MFFNSYYHYLCCSDDCLVINNVLEKVTIFHQINLLPLWCKYLGAQIKLSINLIQGYITNFANKETIIQPCFVEDAVV